MYLIEKRPGEHLFIGFEGENKARKVIFDLSDWEKRYGGEGRVELLYRRPGDTAPYPVALERVGRRVAWTVTATDTANPGPGGRAELRYILGDILVKSESSQVTVSAALEGTGKVPDPPGQSWLDQVLQAADRAARESGFYTPHVTQPEPGLMRISYLPSQQNMEPVQPQTIVLPAGTQGEAGPQGADGKSAYAYAQQAGYTGTEEEFAQTLAEAGQSSGSGLPDGGEEGQVLTMGADGAAVWADVTDIGEVAF